MTKYEAVLYWGTEDEAFIAEVPELPECAADGGTGIEALENVEAVIQEWTESRPPQECPGGFGKRLSRGRFAD